jgi:hypothetical protein
MAVHEIIMKAVEIFKGKGVDSAIDHMDSLSSDLQKHPKIVELIEFFRRVKAAIIQEVKRLADINQLLEEEQAMLQRAFEEEIAQKNTGIWVSHDFDFPAIFAEAADRFFKDRRPRM